MWLSILHKWNMQNRDRSCNGISISIGFWPPISAAMRIPSLYLIATTEDPVTYGYLNNKAEFRSTKNNICLSVSVITVQNLKFHEKQTREWVSVKRERERTTYSVLSVSATEPMICRMNNREEQDWGVKITRSEWYAENLIWFCLFFYKVLFISSLFATLLTLPFLQEIKIYIFYFILIFLIVFFYSLFFNLDYLFIIIIIHSFLILSRFFSWKQLYEKYLSE